MSWLTRLRNLGRSDRVTDEIDREMRFHLEERSDQLESAGLTKDDARREARRRFGNVTLEKERTRERDLLTWLETLVADVRYAFRALRATPGFTLVAILSLALGIGANTAIFTLINVAMLKSLPVSRPEELALLTLAGPMSGGKSTGFNRPLLEQLRDRRDVFAGVLLYGSTNADLSIGGEARRVNVGLVSGEFFSVLGVRPAAGRTFAAADDAPGCPSIAVITHKFWQREFTGGATGVGASVPLNGQPFQVVGVTDPAFFGIEFGWDIPVWIPICAERSLAGGSRAGAGLAVARLHPGMTAAQSQAKLAAHVPALLEATTPPNAAADAAARYRASTIGVQPFASGLPFLRDRYGEALGVLMAIAGVVLLVACANIANLLLARATARRREIAVRLALGASRVRLIRQWLTESLLLALSGALAGVLLAFWASRGLVGMLSNSISVDLAPDGTVLGFSVAVGIVTGVLFGVAPAVVFLRSPDSRVSLVGRASSRGIAEGHTRFRLNKVLVVAQLALSLAMVTAAGLLVGSWGRLMQIDPGFRSDGVVLVAVNTGPARLAPEARMETYRTVLDRLRALRGVAAGSAAWITPLGQTSRVMVDASEFTGVARPAVEARLNQVSDRYFATIGAPLLAGRDFDTQDEASSPWVAIVNEHLARTLFGRAAVVGEHFRVQQDSGLSEPIEIVGVAANTKWGALREDDQPIVYYPLAQMSNPGPGMNFALRTNGSTATLASAVKPAMVEVDPRFSLTVTTLSQRVGDSIRQPRTLAVLAGFFGGLALLLAMVGLYGLMSYSVGRRRNEIAVRLALGAARPRVVGMVLGETGRLVCVGVLIGVALSFAATRLVSSFLFNVTPTDPLTFAISSSILIAAALGAAVLPARRAASMNPVTALRED